MSTTLGVRANVSKHRDKLWNQFVPVLLVVCAGMRLLVDRIICHLQKHIMIIHFFTIR